MKEINIYFFILVIVVVVVIALFVIVILHLFQKVKERSNYVLPKQIFCYWHNPNEEHAQVFVNYNRELLRKYNNDWTLHFINESNVSKYLSPSERSKLDDSKKNPVRFSDGLRMMLLYKYGGVWMDISTILVRPNFLNRFRNACIRYQASGLLFEFRRRTEDARYPYIENWFFMAPKRSVYIQDIARDYNLSIRMGPKNFKQHLLQTERELSLKETIGEHPDEIYLLQHAITQRLLLNNGFIKINPRNVPVCETKYLGRKTKTTKYRLIVEQADNTFFDLYEKNDWNHEKIVDLLTTQSLKSVTKQGVYAIKLIGFTRNMLMSEQDKWRSFQRRLFEHTQK